MSLMDDNNETREDMKLPEEDHLKEMVEEILEICEKDEDYLTLTVLKAMN